MSKDLPFLKFNLKPGEQRSFEHEAVHYTVGLDLFSRHDHETRPLYYYPVPILEEDPNLFVLWVEDDAGDDWAYRSPDAGSVTGSLVLCRFNVDLACKKSNDFVTISVFNQKKEARSTFKEGMANKMQNFEIN